MCVCAKSLQSCPTFCDPLDCRPPGSSVLGILQARVLEWVAMPSFKESSQPRDQNQVPCIADGFFTVWVTRDCVIGSGFEKPLKTIKTTWKHKMMLKSLNCRGFSSGWNNFCFIKIILCVVIMDHRRRQWQPTPVLLPGESHGQRSLAGYSPRGHKELDTI